jgi:hypothetical protein
VILDDIMDDENSLLFGTDTSGLDSLVNSTTYQTDVGLNTTSTTTPASTPATSSTFLSNLSADIPAILSLGSDISSIFSPAPVINTVNVTKASPIATVATSSNVKTFFYFAVFAVVLYLIYTRM